MSQWKSNGTEWIPVDREAWAEYCLAHPTEWKAKYPTPPAADLPHRATYINDQPTGIGNLNDGGIEAGWLGKPAPTLPPGVVPRDNQPQPPAPELVGVGVAVEPDLIRGETGIVPEPVTATTAPQPVKRGRGRPRKGI